MLWTSWPSLAKLSVYKYTEKLARLGRWPYHKKKGSSAARLWRLQSEMKCNSPSIKQCWHILAFSGIFKKKSLYRFQQDQGPVSRALILYISIWIFDFGPETFPGLSRNGPQTRESGENRPFARWRHFTTTTRILFAFSFIFKFGNPS